MQSTAAEQLCLEFVLFFCWECASITGLIHDWIHVGWSASHLRMYRRPHLAHASAQAEGVNDDEDYAIPKPI